MSVGSGNGEMHVVAGVVRDRHGKILLTRRPKHVHKGGCWEFPGGKVRNGESESEGLCREMAEEVGIQVRRARPLIAIRHTYPDRVIRLAVWCVQDYDGTAYGREDQQLTWCRRERLRSYHMPEANDAVVNALLLPDLYLVTPEPGDRTGRFVDPIERCLRSGVRLIQLRAKTVQPYSYRAIAREVISLCHAYRAQVLLNAPVEWVTELGADGVHLTSRALANTTRRPLRGDRWVAASCHNEDELEQARRIGCDFVVLSPVLETDSHPGSKALGWARFAQLAGDANMPVYGLGGLEPADLSVAYQNGAQGIAAIRGLWEVAAGN